MRLTLLLLLLAACASSTAPPPVVSVGLVANYSSTTVTISFQNEGLDGYALLTPMAQACLHLRHLNAIGYASYNDGLGYLSVPLGIAKYWTFSLVDAYADRSSQTFPSIAPC